LWCGGARPHQSPPAPPERQFVSRSFRPRDVSRFGQPESRPAPAGYLVHPRGGTGFSSMPAVDVHEGALLASNRGNRGPTLGGTTVKQIMLVVAAVGAALLTAVATLAQTSDPEIQYWGLWQGSDRGVIRLQDQYYTIGKGDQIPGVGTVQDFTNEALIV